MDEQRYLVTALKYRPQTFDELVAQEHVSDTLKNAIKLDRLAHAYLFSGPRGVGKTTAARILAKAINCTTPLEDRPDHAEPCRSCPSCLTFEEGRSLNIIEIDAASNNKVEDIRDLRETVRVPPQGARKKVYIVDEVHMLSNAAFNALLKTLEEPPRHVLFIFATTEPHKVLPTILSRCQRFDFRRIPIPDIVGRLEEIARQERVGADEASMMLIARKGDGSLRDAQSVFDQAVSLCGTNLTYGELSKALGVVDVDLFFRTTQHGTDGNTAGMLKLVEHVTSSGHDLLEFLGGLMEHLRNLLVARTMNDTNLIEAAAPTRKRYAEAATVFSETDLLRLLTVIEDASQRIKGSTQPRLVLEMALLKMASLHRAADLRSALQKIDRIEEAIRSGEGIVVKEVVKEVPQQEKTDEESAGSEKSSSPRLRRAEAAESARNEPDVAAAPPRTPAPAATKPDNDTTEPDASREKSGESSPAPAPRKARSRSGTRETPTAAEPKPVYPQLFGSPALSRKPAQKDSGGPEPPTDSAYDGEEGGAATMTLAAKPAVGRLQEDWAAFARQVKMDRIHVGSLLQHTRPIDEDGEALVVAVPDDFHLRLLNNQHDYLLKHLSESMHGYSDLQFVVREGSTTVDPAQAADDFDPQAYMQQKRQENPVVQAIFEKFGGELVW